MTTHLHQSHNPRLPAPADYAAHVEKFSPQARPVPRYRFALVGAGFIIALLWLAFAFYYPL